MRIFFTQTIVRVMTCATAALVMGAGLTAGMAHANQSCSVNSDGYCEVDFKYTGNIEHWAIPDNVSQITVTLAGGVGYDWGHYANYQLESTQNVSVDSTHNMTVAVGAGAGTWPRYTEPGTNPLGKYFGGTGWVAGGAGSFLSVGDFSLVVAGSGATHPYVASRSGVQVAGSSTDTGVAANNAGGGGGFHGGAEGTAGTCALNGVENTSVCSSVYRVFDEPSPTAGIPHVPDGFLKITYLSPDFASGPHINSVGLRPGGFSLEFSQPSYSGASDVTSYEYSLDHGVNWHSFSNPSLLSPLTVLGLTPGATYSLELRAVNSAGGGQASNEIQNITIPTAPGTINDVSISDQTPTSVTLHWAEPDSGGLPITEYQISQSKDGGNSWTSVPNIRLSRSNALATTVNVSGLTPATSYLFSVVAVNQAGASDASTNYGTNAVGTGLKADFYNSPTLPAISDSGLSKCNSTVTNSFTFDWGSGRPVINGASGSCGADNFLIHFSGYVQWPGTQDGSTRAITFATGSDDGSALFINGTQVVSMWRDQGFTSTNGSITLLSGTLYPIDFWYFEDSGLASVSLHALNDGIKFFQNKPLVSVQTLSATVPSATQVSSATTGHSQVLLNFNPPDDNGGVEVTNYEYSLDDGSSWVAASPAQTSSPLLIAGLKNGTTYSVKLRAVNSVGSGTASNAVSVKPIAPASAPSISGVVAGNGQATLSISAPSQINDSSLSGYDYSTNNGSTWSHFASATGPFTITGLTNATTYQVKVRAVNSAGVGEASSAVVVSPTKLIPAKPVISTVVGGNSSATVTISAPTDATSQSITGYQYSINRGASYQNASVSNGAFTISGLTNGVSTSVQIRAVNFNGTSLASLAKTVIPATSPSAPVINSITPSAGALSVAFTAPNSGGSAITGYQYSVDGGANWVAPKTAIKTSPLKITGLANATSYQVKIRAVNARGIGDASETSVGTTPVLVPTAPKITSIAKTNTSFTVDVDAPTSNGGAAITNYAYSIDSGKTWVLVNPASNSTRIVITGLKSNTTYPVQIAAVNSAGRGAASAGYRAATLR